MPRAPALLQVLPALESGGVERGTLEIAEAQINAGFRAIVGTAETGASVIRPLPAPTEEAPVVQPV